MKRSLGLLLLPTLCLAAADPVIAPPGGNTPQGYVSPAGRVIPEGAIQHIVCFKLKVPTADAPVTLQSLQTLDPSTGLPAAGSASAQTLSFTTLPALVDAVRQAYYAEAVQVPYMRGFGGGANMSHEGTSASAPNGFGLGYDICFSGAFASENDRDYFVGNDAFPLRTDQHHHAFRNFVGPAIAGDPNAVPAFGGGLMVFDYQVR